jgi:hypothetical protein
MDIDAEVCLCFHVSKRKLVNFLRIEKPKLWDVSQFRRRHQRRWL